MREEEIREQQLRDLAAKAWMWQNYAQLGVAAPLNRKARQQRAELASAPATESWHRRAANVKQNHCDSNTQARKGWGGQQRGR